MPGANVTTSISGINSALTVKLEVTFVNDLSQRLKSQPGFIVSVGATAFPP